MRVAGPDATPPALVRAELIGAQLKPYFDETLDATSAPPGAALLVFSWHDYNVEGTGTAAIEDEVVTVTLTKAARSPDEVWYAPHHAGGKPLRDAAGNEVPRVGCWDNELCEAYGWGRPKLVSGMVSGKSVTLRFSETLDESSVPKPRAFSVTVDDAAATSGDIAVSGREVTMQLPGAVAADAVV